MLDQITRSVVDVIGSRKCITLDNLMDILDECNVPITKTDYVAEMVNGMGFHIYDHFPTEVELLDAHDGSQQNLDFDYAQSDYEAVFSESLEIDPGLQSLIAYVQEIKPAQHGEANYLFDHMSPETITRLFDMNLRSVLRIALGMSKNCDIELADLIQYGSLGLLTAIDKYDISSESPFSSYANYWIFQSIARNTSFHGNGCYYPVHMSDLIKQVIGIVNDHWCQNCSGDNLQCENLINEIVKKCEIDDSTARKILTYLVQPVSVEELIETDDEALSDEGLFNETMLDRIANMLCSDDIQRALECLSEKERDILKKRCGFNMSRCMTLEECGVNYGVTRERIRQIEGKVIRKLRHPTHSKKLKGYY